MLPVQFFNPNNINTYSQNRIASTPSLEFGQKKTAQTVGFIEFPWQAGKLGEGDPEFPTELHAWLGPKRISLQDSGTHFGFVQEGQAQLRSESGNFKLTKGMYFSVPGKLTISGGKGIIVTRLGHKGLFQLGGPVESDGRLNYIDGCKDTLLVAPVKKGDPCLNMLYFPANINQTSHTHPSDRLGLIFDGEGVCGTNRKRPYPLVPGTIFRIPKDGLHRFQTEKSPMRVLAFHPDSDFGPTDQNHPMINRTIVKGVSAARIRKIQTKK